MCVCDGGPREYSLTLSLSLAVQTEREDEATGGSFLQDDACSSGGIICMV